MIRVFEESINDYITLDSYSLLVKGDEVSATYEYDNEIKTSDEVVFQLTENPDIFENDLISAKEGTKKKELVGCMKYDCEVGQVVLDVFDGDDTVPINKLRSIKIHEQFRINEKSK